METNVTIHCNNIILVLRTILIESDYITCLRVSQLCHEISLNAKLIEVPSIRE